MDICIVLMLISCIIYCRRLEKKIEDLKNKKSGFVRIINKFESLCKKAETDVNEIQEITSRLIKQINSITNNAKISAAELKHANDMASETVSEIEAAIFMYKKLKMHTEKSINKSNYNPQNTKYREEFVNNFKNNQSRMNIQSILKTNETLNKDQMEIKKESTSTPMFSNYRNYSILNKIKG